MVTRTRCTILLITALLWSCGGGSSKGVPSVGPSDTGTEAGSDASSRDSDGSSDGDTGASTHEVVFTGKDPQSAQYKLVAARIRARTMIESNDRVKADRVIGRIEEVGERDRYTVRGPIETLDADGNIEVRVDGEIRKNGPRIRSKEPTGGQVPVGMTVHSSVALLENNGRASERVIAKYAARAFEKAGFGYRIVYNLFPERPPDEKSNCSAGDAPQWWGDRVEESWRKLTNLEEEDDPSIRLEEDINVLLLDANGGGCGAIGGRYGTAPAQNIGEMREWKPVGSGDWHRNVHGTLHEIGHQLGARHDHQNQKKGAQHPGRGWNAKGPNGETWWHRTPTTAGNGAPNQCGTMIEKRQSQRNVRRHQTYAKCAVELFDLKRDPVTTQD